MSLRDDPDSHKVIVPLVAGLSSYRAYATQYGGIGGPGLDRQTLPESWVNKPRPGTACDSDPATDKFLELWLDASDPATLVLSRQEENEEGVPMQRNVEVWLDRSGKGRHASMPKPFQPKLAEFQPFFAAAVDFTAPCAIKPVEETP